MLATILFHLLLAILLYVILLQQLDAHMSKVHQGFDITGRVCS